MLYVTTCNTRDAFTVRHTLTQSRGEDGGLYVPLRFPKLTEQEVRSFLQMSFGQCVAEMLNQFFSTKLSGWDVDFSVGRYPVRMEPLGHRIYMAEVWHNLQWHYGYLEEKLRQLLESEEQASGNWPDVACAMAVLAGLLGSREIPQTGAVDIALVSGDFTAAMAARYLRDMGFPIGNIICCCNENKQPWDLLCNGQVHTDESCVSTIIPEADVTLPVNLERLIFACGGAAEVQRYRDCRETGATYAASEGTLQKLRQGLYVSVVSSDRVETTIPNVYNTHQSVLSPASALAYSGLLDYRTKTGITREAMVLCDKSPQWAVEVVAKAMNLTVGELEKII